MLSAVNSAIWSMKIIGCAPCRHIPVGLIVPSGAGGRERAEVHGGGFTIDQIGGIIGACPPSRTYITSVRCRVFEVGTA
jgi:hypothetical protein